MVRWLRWQIAKKLLVSPTVWSPVGRVSISVRTHSATVEDFPATEQGYERLAALWDEYSGCTVHDYNRFLASARHYFREPIEVVLDLACGTGRLTRRLANGNRSVFGLDASEAMLREARSRTKAGNICYAQGDFRAFSLDTIFDAVVCASDSLNYVEKPDQLIDVLRCVDRHLRPGGLFVFDVVNLKRFHALATKKTVAWVNGEMFEVYFFYDPANRISEARVVLNGVVERHRRIPLDAEDVQRAAAETGLTVLEHFSPTSLLHEFGRDFYLLRKPV